MLKKIFSKKDTRPSMGKFELADSVILQYNTTIDENFFSYKDMLINQVGINADDLISDNAIKFQLFLMAIALDGKALFNIIENKEQATVIYDYLKEGYFNHMENFDDKMFCIQVIRRYGDLFDEAITKDEIFLDYVISELINNLLGNNIDKYEIDLEKMMYIINATLPLISGVWKRTLVYFQISD